MSDVTLDERRLASLLDVGRGVVAELDLESLLHRVVEVARELTGARYGALGILHPDENGELERFIAHGIDDARRARIGDPPRGRGVLGELIRDPRPLRLADVNAHPRSYGFPAGHPPMRSFLGVPILIRGQAYGNLYLTEKEGGPFDEADQESAVILAQWAAVAIDNARLYERLEARRVELERAVRELRAMNEIALAVGGETELERILETVVKRGRALVEARWLAVLLAEGDELVVTAAAGELGPEVRGARLPIEGTLPGQVLTSRRAERVPELSSRLLASRSQALGIRAEAVMLVPLLFRGEGVGVLLAGDRLGEPRQFSVDDEDLLRSFASSAATAVATAASAAEERLRQSIEATERERGRWARELHDETLQELGALRVTLASALQRGAPESLARAVEDAVARIGSGIDALRGLIAELRPAALDQLGLAVAIEGLAERASRHEGLAVAADVSLGHEHQGEPTRLAPELESAVYRIVQESLTNAAKHARAEHVRLAITERRGRVEVEVEDDGVGFDPQRPAGGFGLTGMRERAAMTGGSLEVRSAPGGGTLVRAVLPVERRPGAGAHAA